VAELIALAVSEVPAECCGRVDKTKAERDELQRRFDEACVAISWSIDDVAWHMVDERTGLGQLRFRWAGEVTPVNVHPKETAGRRLVEFVAGFGQ
jgi:hypothetical protein